MSFTLSGLPPYMTLAAVNTLESLLKQRPSLVGNYHIYDDGFNGVYLDFSSGEWDITIGVIDNGSIEIYGTQQDGIEELEILLFQSVNSDFLAIYDEFVKSPFIER